MRIVHAAPTLGSITVLLDGDPVISGVNYGEGSPYVTIPKSGESGESTFQIKVNPEFIVSAVTHTEEITSPWFKTLLLTETAGAPVLTVLDDSADDLSDEQSSLRFINANAAVTKIDTYVTPPNLTLSGRTPLVSGLEYTKASGIFPLEPEDYQIRITGVAAATTGAGATTTTGTGVTTTTLPKVLYNSGSYFIGPDEEVSLYFIEAKGGGTPNGAIIVRSSDR